MSSPIAPIKDGEIVKTASANSLAEKNSSATSVKKDDFLQLLVAQMQYQDPLEPTDNTEWVSQYAQFTQVEELQNMAASMELSRASSLVGQTVIMEVEDAKGNTTEVQGRVDYVSYEAGKAYLSINGELYDMEDLSLVVDENYLNSVKKVSEFVESLKELPDLSTLTIQDKDRVLGVVNKYADLSDYELGLVSDEIKKVVNEYAGRMVEFMKAAEAEAEAESTAEGTKSEA